MQGQNLNSSDKILNTHLLHISLGAVPHNLKALSLFSRVNTTAKGVFPYNKRIALTSKMKAINLQVNVFLKCGPGVTCKFKRLIFSLGIKSFWKMFSLEF
uniref:Uncharacterized protein n=1 Tax=Equus asinus asinus TaxID=83772 RepID=A0A8C4L1C7_EQUAS